MTTAFDFIQKGKAYRIGLAAERNMRYEKKKQGNNWTAYYDNDTKRYFAEIMYTSREGREQYDYEITQDIYARLGTLAMMSTTRDLSGPPRAYTLLRTQCMALSDRREQSGMKKLMKQ